MPGRSPHRRSPPPPPLISRHSPPRGRMRSPGDHHLEMVSSHGRERREYRPSVRRSRSPLMKRRSYSPPPLKRKVSPPSRELSRRAKISKSPVSRGPTDRDQYLAAEDSRATRGSGSSERFQASLKVVHSVREYKGDRERERGREQALRRGPEGSIDYDISELKKFTVEIVRKPPDEENEEPLNRNITNPDDIVPVRRPGFRGSVAQRGHLSNRQRLQNQPPWMHNEDTFHDQNEGARPLFMRAEPSASSSKERPALSDDYRRIVAIDPSRVSGRSHSHEKSRYSPGFYEEQRRSHYSERERSPYESRHRSPPPRYDYVEPREKVRERRASSREDLRRDLDVRRREERRYSPERGSYERDSDLRTRINEKRSEPHHRAEEREHSSRRYEIEREKHSRSHHSPPPRERKRTGSLERHELARSSRGEAWERERENEKRRRPHSREREDTRRERYEHADHYEESEKSRRPQGYKTDPEHKKYYKSYESKEFIPPPSRGRGGPPIRRGLPPMMRGRGIVRGLNRGFRGGIMGGMVRGVPRAPFMGMRGFPPRFFPPF